MPDITREAVERLAADRQYYDPKTSAYLLALRDALDYSEDRSRWLQQRLVLCEDGTVMELQAKLDWAEQSNVALRDRVEQAERERDEAQEVAWSEAGAYQENAERERDEALEVLRDVANMDPFAANRARAILAKPRKTNEHS